MRTIKCWGLCGEWHIKLGANYAHENHATCFFYQHCWNFTIIALNKILWIVSYQRRGIRMMEPKWVSWATTFFGMCAFGTLLFGLAPKCDLNSGFNTVTPVWYQHVAFFKTFFLKIGCFHAKTVTRVWYTLVAHGTFDSMHFKGMKRFVFWCWFFKDICVSYTQVLLVLWTSRKPSQELPVSTMSIISLPSTLGQGVSLGRKALYIATSCHPPRSHWAWRSSYVK